MSTLLQLIDGLSGAPGIAANVVSGRITPRAGPRPENWPVELREARRRIADRADLCAFISTSTEEGAGDVVAVKDLIDVAGMVTTAGGILLPDEPAARDAAVVERLRRQGCLFV